MPLLYVFVTESSLISEGMETGTTMSIQAVKPRKFDEFQMRNKKGYMRAFVFLLR